MVPKLNLISSGIIKVSYQLKQWNKLLRFRSIESIVDLQLESSNGNKRNVSGQLRDPFHIRLFRKSFAMSKYVQLCNQSADCQCNVNSLSIVIRR
jgi:hypothetical protein